MNWLIICGGSGSTQLYNGIKKFDREANIKFLINMYDDGKSTGEVRKVMNVLGPSDCRKTHIKCYKNEHANDLSSNILSFYDNRYDFETETAMKDILNELDNLDMSAYKNYVYEFFANEKSKEISYKDFNISNLIYSVMYSKYGYEKANEMICRDILDIENSVVLNSFDNVYLSAETESNNILKDEGTIVGYNTTDKIKRIIYNNVSSNFPTLNPEAIKLISESDNIVISTGTFWSSLYPTIEYGKLYRYINESKANKFWITNTIEDKDSKGVNVLEFYKHLQNTDLYIGEFTIFENLDAVDNLQFTEEFRKTHKVFSKHLGNINGKHDSNLLASYLYLVSNGININDIEHIIMDFDDTIYSRNPTPENKNISKKIFKCLKMINLPVSIVSGNTYKSIKDKIDDLNIKYNDVVICANANSMIFHNGHEFFINEFSIKQYSTQIIDFVKTFGLECEYYDDFHIKYKYLTSLERVLLANILNRFFEENNIECKATLTGKTTIDILHKNNNKVKAIQYLNKNVEKMIYIGDELDNGNDSDIPSITNNYINVKSLEDTLNVLEAIRTIKKCDMD